MLAAPPVIAAEACPVLLNHRFQSLQDQKSQSFCQWQGKVILVVNTASYCGFTSQYDGLEKLYARLKGRGLVVVGFPSNDFGDQEPGSDREIADFCRLTYGVQFPMFAKTTVVGKNANPLFATGQSDRYGTAMEFSQISDRSQRPAGFELRYPRQAR